MNFFSFYRSVKNIILSISFFLFFVSPVSASTTLYFGPIEKTYNDSGNVVSEKVYYPAGNSVAVKSITGSTSTTGTTSYLFSDHLGSTVLITKDDGSIEASFAYYPYGDQLNNPINTNTTNNPISDKLYTGQRKDVSTSLYFYNARYYNPTIGHFISADKAEGPNRYAYVGNNPIMRNDPTGLEGGPIDLLNKGINLFNQCQSDPNCKTLINEAVKEAQSLIFQDSSNQQKQPPVAQTTKANNKPGYLPLFLQDNYEIYANIRGARSDYSIIENIKWLIDPESVEYNIDTVYLGTKKVYYGLGNQTLQAQPNAGKKDTRANSTNKVYQVKDVRNIGGIYDFPFTSHNAFIPDAITESSCSAAGGSLRSGRDVCTEEIEIGTNFIPPWIRQNFIDKNQLMKECLSYTSPQECVVEASKSILPVTQVDIETAKKLKNQQPQ